MKKILLAALLIVSLDSFSQSVFGYWYGNANVKANSSASNYLVELILQPEKGYVKGVLNYFFKNTYRSLQVKGNYNAATRQLSLYNIPVTYYGSVTNMEVDCMMNMQATLRVAKSGSNLTGKFVSLPEFKYVCAEITFDFGLNADISKTDSVLQALREYKESYQVWKPEVEDTLVTAKITPRKVVNYVSEKEFTERENVIAQEIEVESDSLQVDIYDNGEIDGDMISLFYNKQLILNNQKLTHKSIRLDLVLDTLQPSNEISLFAENLGLIPPNTALVVIHDAAQRYELRLSSSLEKNATIRIKRKPLKKP
ncbi:MAG TPA: hypothetical protein VF487_11855 [Chitinophagaceae bacterium]